MIASHFLAGTAEGRADAIPWLVLAAERDLDDYAFESAVASYERALAEIDAQPDAADDERLRVLLAYANALRHAGMGRKRRTVLLDAADLARRLDRPDALASVAIAIASGNTPRGSGRASGTATALLEEAVHHFPESGTRVRTQLLCHLAIQRYLAGDDSRALSLVAEAQAAAAELQDPAIDLLVCAARAGEALDPVENLERAREWFDASQRVDDVDQETWARINLVWANTAAGRLLEARDETVAFEQRVRALRRPTQLWWATVWEASRATIAGRFGDANALIDEAATVGVDPHGNSAAVQVWLLRVAVQRLDEGVQRETVVELEDFRSRLASASSLGALDAYVRWHAGQRIEIAEQLRTGSRSTVLNVRDGNQLAYTSLLAEVVAGAGVDRRVVEDLYAWLRPYAGRYVVLGFGGAVFGSVDRVLGLLAAAAGRRDDATAHFDAAIRSFDDNHATPWASLTREERTRLLAGG